MRRELIPADDVEVRGDLVPQTEGTQVVVSKGPAVLDVERLRVLAETAEERVQLMDRIIRASLAVCRPQDWVDLGGRPYPTEAGAERMARLWGIHIRVVEGPERIDRGDHYIYRTKVHARSDLLGRSTEVVGMRSSRDPFFCVRYITQPDGTRRREILPMEAVDERAVAVASQTNAKVRAIGELLGLRGLSWEDLERYGFTPERAAGRVVFEKTTTPAAPSQETPKPSAASSEEEERLRQEIREWLLQKSGGDEAAAAELLRELTTFKGKRGRVPGVTSLDDLHGKRLRVVYDRMKKEASA